MYCKIPTKLIENAREGGTVPHRELPAKFVVRGQWWVWKVG